MKLQDRLYGRLSRGFYLLNQRLSAFLSLTLKQYWISPIKATPVNHAKKRLPSSASPRLSCRRRPRQKQFLFLRCHLYSGRRQAHGLTPFCHNYKLIPCILTSDVSQSFTRLLPYCIRCCVPCCSFSGCSSPANLNASLKIREYIC